MLLYFFVLSHESAKSNMDAALVGGKYVQLK